MHQKPLTISALTMNELRFDANFVFMFYIVTALVQLAWLEEHINFYLGDVAHTNTVITLESLRSVRRQLSDEVNI